MAFVDCTEQQIQTPEQVKKKKRRRRRLYYSGKKKKNHTHRQESVHSSKSKGTDNINKTKQNKTKQNKTKQNKTKQNKTKQKQIGRKERNIDYNIYQKNHLDVPKLTTEEKEYSKNHFRKRV